MNIEEQKNWEKAKPGILPQPTYFPFLLAISVMLLGWGLIALWPLSIAGIIGIAVSLYGWVMDMMNSKEKE